MSVFKIQEKRLTYQRQEKKTSLHCCVPLCANSSRYNSEISFHRFPVDPEVRARWLTQIRGDNFSPLQYSALSRPEPQQGDPRAHSCCIPRSEPMLVYHPRSGPLTVRATQHPAGLQPADLSSVNTARLECIERESLDILTQFLQMVGFGGRVRLVGEEGGGRHQMATPLQRSGGERLSHPRRQPGTVPTEILGASPSPYGLPGVSACSGWLCRGWPGQYFTQPGAVLAGMGAGPSIQSAPTTTTTANQAHPPSLLAAPNPPLEPNTPTNSATTITSTPAAISSTVTISSTTHHQQHHNHHHITSTPKPRTEPHSATTMTSTPTATSSTATISSTTHHQQHHNHHHITSTPKPPTEPHTPTNSATTMTSKPTISSTTHHQ
ncbi:hypothetical protein NFI96_019902 [Prochilodus magdalenae]|nr:hypothetical protein NFI96_019902 [Prochilodus magdalenae]